MSGNNSSELCEPTYFDVLLGRGKSNAEHAGNMFYRGLIHKYHNAYFSLRSQREKNILSSQMVKEIKANSGRFLKKCKDGWKEICDETARIKISHSLQYYERLRRKDEETNQQQPVSWNVMAPSQASLVQSKVPLATVPTQLMMDPRLQNVGNIPTFKEQQPQSMPITENKETELEFMFLGKPLLANSRSSGHHHQLNVSPAALAGSMVTNKRKDDEAKSQISSERRKESVEVCVPFTPTKGINKSKINNQSKTRNRPLSHDKSWLDEKSQKCRQSENFVPKSAVDLLRARNLDEAIMQQSPTNNSATATTPENCESFNNTLLKDNTLEKNDVFDYEYENPLLAKPQAQSKTIIEHFTPKELMEVAEANDISQDEMPKAGASSYSSRQLLAITAPKRRSLHATHNEEKLREIDCSLAGGQGVNPGHRPVEKRRKFNMESPDAISHHDVISKATNYSTRSNSFGESIGQRGLCSSTVTCSNQKISPQMCKSSDNTPIQDTITEENDGLNYEYEYPSLTERQEQVAANTIDEDLTVNQRIESDPGNGIFHIEPFQNQAENGSLSYSSQLLLSLTSRERESLSATKTKNPSDGAKVGTKRQPRAQNMNNSNPSTGIKENFDTSLLNPWNNAQNSKIINFSNSYNTRALTAVEAVESSQSLRLYNTGKISKSNN